MVAAQAGDISWAGTRARHPPRDPATKPRPPKTFWRAPAANEPLGAVFHLKFAAVNYGVKTIHGGNSRILWDLALFNTASACNVHVGKACCVTVDIRSFAFRKAGHICKQLEHWRCHDFRGEAAPAPYAIVQYVLLTK